MLDIQEDTGFDGAKPIETPMDPNMRLCVDQGELLSSPHSYQRLAGKLKCLNITHSSIMFVECG